jgi:uncharacterized protein (DUF952 family)
MSQFLYHLARRADWEKAEAGEPYFGSADDLRDGFIHFSTASQVMESAARHRAGEADNLLIVVAECGVSAWRWEKARSGALFPHLYGALPMDSVVGVHELPLGPDGLHIFPPLG